jgi:hypothetical protein
MVNPSQIKADMPVVCSNQVPFAVVERMEDNDWICVRHDDNEREHYIPLSWVRAVDESVHIDRPARQAMLQWSTEPSFNGLKSARRISTAQIPAVRVRKIDW